MLNKKILGLIIAASALTPVANAIVEVFDTECVEAATNFVDTNSLTKVATSNCLYV